MAGTMHWANGFRRIRLIGTVALGLGVLLLLVVFLTQLLGYGPDPAFAQLYGAFWPLGLMLLVLGVLLWLVVWVLMGFLPSSESAEAEPSRARFYR